MDLDIYLQTEKSLKRQINFGLKFIWADPRNKGVRYGHVSPDNRSEKSFRTFYTIPQPPQFLMWWPTDNIYYIWEK